MKFRKASAITAVTLTMLSSPLALVQAAEITERVEQAEQRIRYLEQRVQDQQVVLQQADDGKWFDAVEISGLIEVEVSYTDPEQGESESDIAAATVELGLSGQLSEQLSAEITLLYEDGDSELDVDVAQLTYALANSPMSLTAGQVYLPFGAYETGLISDPLTLEVGETRETALLLGFEQDRLSGSFYVFNGDNSEGGDNTIDNWGASIGFANDGFAIGLGYINDLGDSDALQDSLATNDVAEYTPGVSSNVSVALGPVTLITEYVAATDAFATDALEGNKPSASNLEVNYEFPLAGKTATFATAYQVTEEALILELPETRVLLGLAVEVNDNVGLGVEFSRDEDYDLNEGGSGESSHTFLVQLAAAF